VNRKRVVRLMRADNLLVLLNRRFVNTTNSVHRLPVYPNLVPELVVTKCDQLWVSDITYIRQRREFIYLAVILDAFSRRCIGWALERTLETELALSALRRALSARTVTAESVPSLGPGRAVRLARLHEFAQGTSYPHQHEQTRQPFTITLRRKAS